MTSKQALKELLISYDEKIDCEKAHYCEIIEKDLEVLDIIKNKLLRVDLFINTRFEYYAEYKRTVEENHSIVKQISKELLTETEFNLIKEWFER